MNTHLDLTLINYSKKFVFQNLGQAQSPLSGPPAFDSYLDLDQPDLHLLLILVNSKISWLSWLWLVLLLTPVPALDILAYKEHLLQGGMSASNIANYITDIMSMYTVYTQITFEIIGGLYL